MIEGFKIRVSSEELKSHCEARAIYHRERAEHKEQELPALKEAFEKIKAGGGKAADTLARMSKGGYHSDPQDAVDGLETDIRNHRNKSLVFDFYSKHLIPEDYQLSKADLVELEILKAW